MLKQLKTRLPFKTRPEPVILAAIIVAVLAVWGFAALAVQVTKGDTAHFDRTILLMLRNPANLADPIGPPWVEEIMRDLTAFGGIAVLTMVTIFAAIYLFILKKSHSALYLLAAVTTGTLLANLLKLGINRPRPDLVPHETVVYTASFPSGHSMMSAVVYLTLGSLLARAQTNRLLRIYIMSLAAFLTVVVGVSRIYLGVHWPTDVLAGWIAGSCCALAFWTGARLLAKKHVIET